MNKLTILVALVTSLPLCAGTLSNRSLLVNGFIHPNHALYDFNTVSVIPFIGAGIGYGYNQVTNFYTVASKVVDDTAVGSTASIGNPIQTNSFAWQGSVGLNIKPQISYVSFDLGYRYYDGGHFNTSSRGLVIVTPWSGRVTANQLFVDFKYTA